MVHGRTVDDCEQTLKAISAKTGLTENLALYSSKEYKKTRVQYFTPEAEEWEARALASQPA
jgi:predicted PhzF superfamily epimerase YddE/YHI9